jgi:hypothetical protein
MKLEENTKDHRTRSKTKQSKALSQKPVLHRKWKATSAVHNNDDRQRLPLDLRNTREEPSWEF